MVCNIVNYCKNYKHYLLALEIQCTLASQLDCIMCVRGLLKTCQCVCNCDLVLIGLCVFKDVPGQHHRPGLQTALLQNRQQTVVRFH